MSTRPPRPGGKDEGDPESQSRPFHGSAAEGRGRNGGGHDGDAVVRIAARAGRLMLESGSETNRVQDTVNALCLSLGMVEAESFATPTGLMLTAVNRQGRAFTMVTRITSRAVDLEKVSRTFRLVRTIGPDAMDSHAVAWALDRIEGTPHYPVVVKVLAGSLAAACCSLLFGGGYREALASLPVGALVKLLSILLAKVRLNEFLINVVGGTLAAMLAFSAAAAGLTGRPDRVIVGSIMLLIPGLTMVSAIRDTIAGDLVAGISRAVEALIVAAAIAIGTGLGIRLWMLLFGGL